MESHKRHIKWYKGTKIILEYDRHCDLRTGVISEGNFEVEMDFPSGYKKIFWENGETALEVWKAIEDYIDGGSWRWWTPDE